MNRAALFRGILTVAFSMHFADSAHVSEIKERYDVAIQDIERALTHIARARSTRLEFLSKPEIEQSLPKIEELAHQECARASLELGHKYFLGTDIHKNWDRARYYYFKAGIHDPQLVLNEALVENRDRAQADMLLTAAYTYRYPPAEPHMLARLAQIEADKKFISGSAAFIVDKKKLDRIYKQGVKHFNNKKYRQALNKLQSLAVDHFDSYPRSALYVARSLLKVDPSGNLERASKYFKDYFGRDDVEDKEDDADYRYQYGIVLLRNEDAAAHKDEAKRAFQIASNHGHEEASLELAKLLIASDQLTDQRQGIDLLKTLPEQNVAANIELALAHLHKKLPFEEQIGRRIFEGLLTLAQGHEDRLSIIKECLLWVHERPAIAVHYMADVIKLRANLTPSDEEAILQNTPINVQQSFFQAIAQYSVSINDHKQAYLYWRMIEQVFLVGSSDKNIEDAKLLEAQRRLAFGYIQGWYHPKRGDDPGWLFAYMKQRPNEADELYLSDADLADAFVFVAENVVKKEDAKFYHLEQAYNLGRCTCAYLRRLFDAGKGDLANQIANKLIPYEKRVLAKDAINKGVLDKIEISNEMATIALLMAHRYRQGAPGLEPDSQFSYYLAYAALAGHDMALFDLAHCVQTGSEGFIKNLDLAVLLLNKIASDAPAYPAAHIFLANFRIKEKKYAEGVEQFLLATNSPHFMEKDLKSILDAMTILTEHQQFPELLKLYDGVIKLASRFPNAPLINETRERKAEFLIYKMRLKEITSEISELLENSDRQNYQSAKIRILLNKGDYRQVEPLLRDLLENADKTEELWSTSQLIYGYVLFRNGKYKQAAAKFQIAADANRRAAKLNIVFMHYLQRDKEFSATEAKRRLLAFSLSEIDLEEALKCEYAIRPFYFESIKGDNHDYQWAAKIISNLFAAYHGKSYKVKGPNGAIIELPMKLSLLMDYSLEDLDDEETKWNTLCEAEKQAHRNEEASPKRSQAKLNKIMRTIKTQEKRLNDIRSARAFLTGAKQSHSQLTS